MNSDELGVGNATAARLEPYAGADSVNYHDTHRTVARNAMSAAIRAIPIPVYLMELTFHW